MEENKLDLLKAKLKQISLDGSEFDQSIKRSFETIFSATSFNNIKTNEFLNLKQEELNEKNELLQIDYETNIENLNKSYVIGLEKNKDQIQKYFIDAEENINTLKQQFYYEKHLLNKEIIDAEVKNIKILIENQNFYNEEVNHIKLEIKERSLESNIVNQRYENEKQLKLTELTNSFNLVKTKYDEQTDLISSKYQNQVLALKETLKEELANKDNSYLTIKKTHTQSSVKFNNFINTISTTNRTLIQENINKYQSLLLFVDEEISKENEKHEQLKLEIQRNSFEKIKALNIVFDVQKDVYNQKTTEIVELNNVEVTKINSQLRIKRDELNKKIDILEKEKWNTLTKTKTQEEKNIVSKKYNKDINQLKNMILQLISQNKQDLSKQEIKFQTNLFNHDYEHIKQINEWRYSKNLYDYERKLEIEQEVLRLQQVLFEKDEKKRMYANILAIKQEIQKNETEEDLLPIESQLYLASSLQNREINLLNQEFESNKLNNELNQKLLNQQKLLEILPLNHNLNIEKSKYEKQSRIIELTYQLEINKEILKRDIFVSNLNLNIELQNILLENKNKRANQDLKSLISINNIKIEDLVNTFEYNSKTISKTAEIEEQKRNAIIQEIKIKNQKLINNKQNHKNIAVSKNIVEIRESTAHHYVDQILDVLYNEKLVSKNIQESIESNIHPESIRSLIDLAILYVEYSSKQASYIINLYYENTKKDFLTELNNLTSFKYKTKYEEINTLYKDNMRVINIGREDLIAKQKVLNDENVIISNKTIQNRELIRLHQKSIANNQDSKIAKKQIFTLENEIKILSRTLKSNNKVLKTLDNQLKPLDISMSKFAKQKLDSEQSIEKEKTLEESQYRYLFKILERDFEKLNLYIDKHQVKILKIYQHSFDKLYLVDNSLKTFKDSLTIEYKKLFSTVINYSQKILSFWLKLYVIAETEQLNIISNFDKYTSNTTKQIKDSFSKFILIEEKAKTTLTSAYLNKKQDLNGQINYLQEKLNNKTTSNHKDYNHFYKETEVKIQENLKTRNNNFALINENLNDVINNLKKQLEVSYEKLNLIQKKEHLEILTEIIYLKNEITNNENRSNIRINTIINRYNNDKKNHLKSMNSKRNKINNHINKLTHSIKGANNDYIHIITEHDKTTKLNHNSLNIDLVKFKNKSRLDKIKLTKKERKTLKRSYRFKAKQIKLESKK